MIEITKLADIKHRYDDIINLEHFISKKYKHMSIMNRASQFAPFAALTGYGEQILDASIITENKILLSEDMINDLNDKLNLIKKNIKKIPKVSIIYFMKDKNKDGGKYINIINNVKKIDTYNDEILFINKEKILISNIISIDIFND